ncbi:MAG: CHAT domain-containing protein, partial [Propionibacteriales bacterium]|nr:CHAT domain-containing protein [Propionibacteriales bacterium]
VSGGRFTGSVLAYPHIGGPEAVVVGTPFDVTIGLSPRRDRSLVTAGAVALPPGKPIDVGLMVTYDPDSLRLETPLPTTIRVNPANPYVVVAARFVALDGDDLGAERRIGVHYLLDGVVIGVAWKRFVAAWDESELAGLPRPDPRERTLLNLAPVLREEAPDLVVAVYRADDATGDYFVWSAYPSMSGFAVPDTQRSGRIGDESKQFATDGRRSVAQGGDPVGLFTQLHGRALDIGRAIPVAMRETLRELATGRETPATVLLLTEEVHIPWELAAFRPPLESAGGGTSPYLGAHVAIARWPLTDTPPPEPVPVRRLDVTRTAVVSARYDGVPGWPQLDHAEREAADLLKGYRPSIEVKPLLRDVIACLNGQPRADVLHFAMHGQFDPDSINEGLVLLAEKADGSHAAEFLKASQVQTGDLPRSFVFLNACQVGAAKQVLGDYGGMAVAFLRAGASGVVAPLWNVDDAVAGEVAREFYAGVYAEDAPSAAEVLRRIRARYTQGGAVDQSADPTLIAYQLYGHPRLQLRRVPGDDPPD